MSWEKKKFLIVVKAYPERSGSYGSTICMAGLTEDNEWIRIYPVVFDYYIKKLKFEKFTWIEAEIRKAKEKLKRKESYKVNMDSIRVVDTSLVLKGKTEKEKRKIWSKRREIINNNLSSSIYELKENWKKNNLSLGVIKPKLIDLHFRKPIDDIKIEHEKLIQKTLDGKKISVADQIEHKISYKFKCQDSKCSCNYTKKKHHDIICEDWELGESLRTWDYSSEEKEMKIRQKYFDEMKIKRDLYFFMGMYSQFTTWLIIGLFYPPKIGEGIGLSRFI